MSGLADNSEATPAPHERHDPTGLTGRRIVVTGSSRGIGRAVAVRLAREGATVVLHGRTWSTALEETLAVVRGLSPSSVALPTDFAAPGGPQQLLEAAFRDPAGVQGWVHAAGADVLTTELRGAPLADRLDALWRVDVAAMLMILPAVARRVIDAEGGHRTCSVVTIGWDQAGQGMAGESGWIFGAVKGAVEAATRAMAQDFAPRVRFNCIAPGWIRTGWGEQASEAWQRRAVAESLAGRWGTPEDVAALAAFLMRDESAFLNGQVLSLNGGFRFGRPDLTG